MVVPKVLSPDQKQMRVELCEEWLAVDAESEVLNRVVTGDKSWINEYDPRNKRQSMGVGTLYKESTHIQNRR